MLGDVLLITDKHREAGEEIIDHILKNRKDKMMIGISGESGSGKSELAHVIAKGLRKHGIFAKPIHIDNYYKVLPLKSGDEWMCGTKLNTVALDESKSRLLGHFTPFDIVLAPVTAGRAIYQNIQDFKASRVSTMPCVDLVTEQVDRLTTDFNGIDMLIIDGLYAIKTNGLDLSIFIELTYHETKKAQVVRGKEPQNEYRMAVLEQEHKMVQALKTRADIFIDINYKVRFNTEL